MVKRTYEQAAGFLMVYEGSNPLDCSLIHPESYKIAKSILKKIEGIKGLDPHPSFIYYGYGFCFLIYELLQNG